MKTILIKLLLTIVVLTGMIGQVSAQTTYLGSYSDSFHICHDYVSGEAVTFTISSPMHVTMHTYSPEEPLRPVDDTVVPSSTAEVSVISVHDLAVNALIARQSGSLYRKYVHDPSQACLVFQELPAGTYSVSVEGDESTLLTLEGFLTSPPHSLDGREAGQPIEMGTFSAEFGYSHIRDTSGDGYWAGYGSPSNDVFYKFTITEPMYVVVNHWGTVPMSQIVSSRISVLACDPAGIIQYPALASVSDISSEDNLMGNDNLVSLLIGPDRIPEIEYNGPLCASWHGMLLPGIYYVVSEGPYTASNSALTFNGPIRTNIRGFIRPGIEERSEIDAGASEDGVMEFQDSKFFGMAENDVITYRFVLDTVANLSVTTDADNLVLKKGDETLSGISGTAAETWEQLAAGEYTLSLTAAGNRIISTIISSEKYVTTPDVPSDDIPSYVPETLDKKNNFVRVLRPFREGSADPDRIDLGNSRQTIDYYDGLGRHVQTVRRRETPSGDDLATYIRYEYGRPVEEWNETSFGKGKAMIPYSSIKASAESAYMDSSPYKRTEYEDSPLSRTISVTGYGEAWHAAGKSVGYEYLVNDTTGVLSCLRFEPSEGYNDAAAPVLSGMYSAGALTVTRTVSEDGIASYSFTDKAGQTILSRVVDGEDFVDTYYVYDVRRMLRAVITPAAVDAIGDSGVLSSSVFNSYCYAYGYDERGRCVEASKPGCGVTRTVYSEDSYPLFVQTPELASEEKWKFDIPDIFGRKALTGICTGTYESLKETAEAGLHAVFGDGLAASGFWQTTAGLESVELHQAFYYDDYSFMEKFGSRSSDLAFDSAEVSVPRRDATGSGLTCRGMMTGSLTRNLDTGEMMLSATYYDIYGNVIQTRSENILGGISSISAETDFQGNVLVESETHVMADDSASVLTRIHEYDRAGRLMQTVTDLDGVEVVTRNTYDPVGRLEMTIVTSGEVSDTTLRSYNVRGWQTEIKNDSWSAQMRYNNPLLSGSVASFTGNISEWEWSRGENSDTKAYSLSYDALSRITGSRLFRNGNPVDALSESGISYDSNGNLLSLTRTGEDGSAVNDLSYHYDGNRLECLVDNGELSENYAYDADGNMTFDGRTGMSLEWNDLGLVEKVSLNDTVLVNYSYLADGTKVSALDGDGDGLLYLGSLIYRKTGSNISLESAGFAGGRFVARETSPGVSSMVPMIHVTDHLGSVRAVVDGISGAVVETNDYYPFGSRWNTTASLTDNSNRFRYNSKEEQFRFGTPYIDYGARQYDPVLGRWFAQDPLSEKYYGISPYAFCNNNSVKNIDSDGNIPFLANLVGGVASVVVEYGGQVIGNMIEKGEIKGAAFTDVDITDLGVAFAEGFVTSGTNIVKKVATKVAVGIAGEVIRNTVNVNVKDGQVQNPEINPAAEVALNTTMGLAFGSVKTGAKVTPFKEVTANKARETAAAATRGKGNKFTAAESNAAAAKARQNNVSKKEANETLSDAINSAGSALSEAILEEFVWKYERKHH